MNADDIPPPTTSLDYRYVRSSVGVSEEKDLTHFYEIGTLKAFRSVWRMAYGLWHV